MNKMQSILFPKDLTLCMTTEASFPTNQSDKAPLKYIKREGPRGSFIKKRGNFSLSQLSTTEGTRVFVSGVSFQQESLILAQLWKQAIGLSRGYRKRLRLIGIGFRGLKQSITVPSGRTREVQALSAQEATAKPGQTASKKMLLPKYRVRQLNNLSKGAHHNNGVSSKPSTITNLPKRDSLQLKLGYSHDSAFPLQATQKKDRKVEISRADGRTKGTVILVEGASRVDVSSIAAEMQAYRIPDIYKGKGIHADGVSLKLKKGKRQG